MLNSSMPVFLGLLELAAFFVFDMMYARTLNAQKRNFPELEECAPAESPDLDTAAVLDSLATTAVQLYEQNRERMTGEPSTSSRTYTSVDDHTNPAPVESSAPVNPANPLHSVVVVCGTVAPIATILLLLLPQWFGWMAFRTPLWVAYAAVVPGLAAVGLYGMRTVGLSDFVDITKTQWLAMMWFRLDFMFIMAAVSLFGVGAWFIAGCMLATAAYLAHRVMKMEKHLSRIQRDTQLVRDEVDVKRVLVPGSAESKKATGIQEGYSSLAV